MGVRLGEVIDQDMIAVPVSGDQRQGAVGRPVLSIASGKPEHPSELLLPIGASDGVQHHTARPIGGNSARMDVSST